VLGRACLQHVGLRWEEHRKQVEGAGSAGSSAGLPSTNRTWACVKDHDDDDDDEVIWSICSIRRG